MSCYAEHKRLRDTRTPHIGHFYAAMSILNSEAGSDKKTYQLPSLFIHLVYPSDGFHEHVISYTSLADLYCAQ